MRSEPGYSHERIRSRVSQPAGPMICASSSIAFEYRCNESFSPILVGIAWQNCEPKTHSPQTKVPANPPSVVESMKRDCSSVHLSIESRNSQSIALHQTSCQTLWARSNREGSYPDTQSLLSTAWISYAILYFQMT